MKIAILGSGNMYRALGVVASSRRNIKSGVEYDKYFPKPTKKDPFLTYLGTTYHTLDFMKEIIEKTSGEMKKIAPMMKGATLEETCNNIWHFLYNHYQYKMDKASEEELRSPSRAWADRKTGIDCDCFAISAGAILHQLNIPFAIRKAKYNGKTYFQHVYIVVPRKQGLSLENRANYFCIDPVLDKPNYEKEYSEKFDKHMMPIRFLNGFEDNDMSGQDDQLGKTKVGKLLRKAGKGVKTAAKGVSVAAKAGGKIVKKAAKSVAKVAGKVAKAVKKITVKGTFALPRAGLLLAMKLNVGRLAERLGYGYWTDEEAKTKGLNPTEHKKIKERLAKTQKIFKNIGGEEKNLKKAILEGWAKGVKKHNLLHGLAGVYGLGRIEGTLAGLGEIDDPAYLAALGCDCDDDTPTSAINGLMGIDSTDPGARAIAGEGSIFPQVLGICLNAAKPVLAGISEDLGCPEKGLGRLIQPTIKGKAKVELVPVASDTITAQEVEELAGLFHAQMAGLGYSANEVEVLAGVLGQLGRKKGGIFKKLASVAKKATLAPLRITSAVVKAPFKAQKAMVATKGNVFQRLKAGIVASNPTKSIIQATAPRKVSNLITKVDPKLIKAAMVPGAKPAPAPSVAPLPANIKLVQPSANTAVKIDKNRVLPQDLEHLSPNDEITIDTDDYQDLEITNEQGQQVAGLLGLGEPITLAAGTTAAAAFIAKIASMLKGVKSNALTAGKAANAISSLTSMLKPKKAATSNLAPAQNLVSTNQVQSFLPSSNTDPTQVVRKTKAGKFFQKISTGVKDAVVTAATKATSSEGREATSSASSSNESSSSSASASSLMTPKNMMIGAAAVGGLYLLMKSKGAASGGGLGAVSSSKPKKAKSKSKSKNSNKIQTIKI